MLWHIFGRIFNFRPPSDFGLTRSPILINTNSKYVAAFCSQVCAHVHVIINCRLDATWTDVIISWLQHGQYWTDVIISWLQHGQSLIHQHFWKPSWIENLSLVQEFIWSHGYLARAMGDASLAETSGWHEYSETQLIRGTNMWLQHSHNYVSHRTQTSWGKHTPL